MQNWNQAPFTVNFSTNGCTVWEQQAAEYDEALSIVGRWMGSLYNPWQTLRVSNAEGVVIRDMRAAPRR